MRLESLDIDYPQESREELGVLAEELRSEGWQVEVAEEGEATWSRLRESAGHELVDVLNVVLSEAEHEVKGAIVGAILTWAAKRVYFRGRRRAKPAAAVWEDEEIVETVPLPEPEDDGA